QHGQVREQVERLEHHANLAAQRVEPAVFQQPALVQQPGPADLDAALFGDLQAVATAQQRALARAARTDDHHHLGLGNLEVDAAQDGVGAKGLGQAVYGNHAAHCTIPPARRRVSTRRSTAVVRVVSTKYTAATARYTSSERYDTLMIFWPSCIKSWMVSSDTSAEFLISAMNSLPSGGIIRMTAWGRMMIRIDCTADMPSERAASFWPRSTDWMAPRTISET